MARSRSHSFKSPRSPQKREDLEPLNIHESARFIAGPSGPYALDREERSRIRGSNRPDRWMLLILIFSSLVSFISLFTTLALGPIYLQLGMDDLVRNHLYSLLVDALIFIQITVGWYAYCTNSTRGLTIVSLSIFVDPKLDRICFNLHPNQFNLVTYATVPALLLFALFVSYGIVSGGLHESIRLHMDKSFKGYKIIVETEEEEQLKHQIDSLQKVLLCCGSKGASEFEAKEMVKPYACGSLERGCIESGLILEIALGLLFVLEFSAWIFWFVFRTLGCAHPQPNT